MEATVAEFRAENLKNPATPEEIWAILMRNSLDLDALKAEREQARKEREEERKKQEEEWKKAREEAQKKSDLEFEKMKRMQRRTERQMGYLSNRFGELAEHLVAPGIHARFRELGYSFDRIATKGAKILGADGKTKTEIDIFLENGDTVIAVEVKSKPAIKDVEHHIKRLEIIRGEFNRKNDHRKIQGAIAGAIFGSEEKKAVVEAGLFVIEQSGDTMKIDVPDGFVPREW